MTTPPAQFIEQEYDTGQFDATEYLKQNPDVASHYYFGSRAYDHYQRHGKGEGRKHPTIKKTRQVENPAYSQWLSSNPDYRPFTGAPTPTPTAAKPAVSAPKRINPEAIYTPHTIDYYQGKIGYGDWVSRQLDMEGVFDVNERQSASWPGHFDIGQYSLSGSNPEVDPLTGLEYSRENYDAINRANIVENEKKKYIELIKASQQNASTAPASTNTATQTTESTAPTATAGEWLKKRYDDILKNTTDTGEKPVSLLDHKTITSQPQFIQEEYDTGEFDQAEYLRQNPDVAADSWYGSRPAAHWQYFGQNEGRAYPTIKKTRQVENPNYTAAPQTTPAGETTMPIATSTAASQTTPAGQTPMPMYASTATPTTASSEPQIMDESTGVNVGLGKQIRDQQALGAGNILTTTGATGVDPQTGRFDPSKVEMLYDPVQFTLKDEELRTTEDKLIQVPSVTAPEDISEVQETFVTPEEASLVNNIERTYSNVPTAVAAQGEITSFDVIDPNQIVDERTKTEMFERGSLAEAKTQTLAEEASTAYQIEQLTKGIETGKFPPWAAPTVRKANEIMNQRGLGASSMAAAAVAQAIMESAIPIANSDAQKAATLQIQNLNNQQQTALANAAAIAAMDRQNLDNRMKAAQQNAQSFLQMNLQNVTQEQAAVLATHQSTVQSLFSDQAAENARLQFNATSQNQVNQFYDQLGLTAAENNANRDVAIQKFNSEEQTAVNEFNANLENSRQAFNANMQNVIDQSNISWRRSINTTNTNNDNIAAQQNAQVLLGLTVQAQNNLWQEYRDVAHQLFASYENDRQRTHDIVVQGIKHQFTSDQFQNMLDYRASVEAGKATSGYVDKILGPVINRGASELAKSLFGNNDIETYPSQTDYGSGTGQDTDFFDNPGWFDSYPTSNTADYYSESTYSPETDWWWSEGDEGEYFG